MTLIGYWPLNEDSSATEAKDHSGNENHGEVNGATQGENGIIGGKSFSFDGDNDYVDIDDSDLTEDYAFGKNNSRMSLIIWVYPTDFVNDKTNHDTRNNVFGNAGDGFDDNFELGLDEDRIDVYMELDGDDYTYNISTDISANNWYLIGVTKSDSEGLKVYKNGELVYKNSSRTGTLTVSSGQGFNLTIGKSGHVETFHTGKIQEVRLYDRPLTKSEVQYLYQVGQRGLQTTSKKSS